ncbi:MAG: MATE family efflux transporter [Candidatus Riflebacteria bacterium]|nr:MATE family efflux transporter [Candidatus Riflebacteria bacterium]
MESISNNTIENELTEGKIYPALVKFTIPLLLAMFLQALYSGVDLLIVGRFAETADVSGVATGSMLMMTTTMAVCSLAIGVTILVGRKVGQKRPKQVGMVIGNGITLFSIIALLMTIIFVWKSDYLSELMHAPQEAFSQTQDYIKYCGWGSVFVLAYNLLGGILRGLGDAKTPLFTVVIATIVNIIGDYILISKYHMGAKGAAIATVFAQAVSVLITLIIIKGRKNLPLEFSLKNIEFKKKIIAMIIMLGIPIAIQDVLVGLSFMVIQVLVNSIDLVASAGVGIGEKICRFIMLVPAAFSQALGTFVSQNIGAKKYERIYKALWYGIYTSVAVGVFMGYSSFFHGDWLCSFFTEKNDVITAAHTYLKAYSIDCVLTPFLFCFLGYYVGYGKSFFLMIQGIIGAICIRIPFAYFASIYPSSTVFHIALATPVATSAQIIICLLYFFRMKKKTTIAE